MRRTPHSISHADLACDSCGQIPEPPRVRLTAANIVAMLPVELAVHAAVVQAHLPYVLKVVLLTVTATVLAIWVAEPSASKLLRRWLHAPLLHRRRRIEAAPALWRVGARGEGQPRRPPRGPPPPFCPGPDTPRAHNQPVDGGGLGGI